MTKALTIGEYLSQLLPRLRRRRSAPEWPPDVFALAMSLIQKSGAYASVLNHWPPHGKELSEWVEQTGKDGRAWRRRANTKDAAPASVERRWKIVLDNFREPVVSIRENTQLAQSLLELCALADEACAGVGWVGLDGFDKGYEKFYARAHDALAPKAKGSSLCLEIDPSRMRVLPKQHSPAKGLTIRSLSHHLALCCADEIEPVWESVLTRFESQESLNLLVIPWPKRIDPIQFRPVPSDGIGMKIMHEGAGYFSYRAADSLSEGDLLQTVSTLYANARRSLGNIDGIVFPELSMTNKQFEALRSLKELKKTFVIAGVSQEPDTDFDFGCNQVFLDFPVHGIRTQTSSVET